MDSILSSNFAISSSIVSNYRCSLYENLSYSTVCDIMSFANNYGLDKDIDYEKIHLNLKQLEEIEKE